MADLEAFSTERLSAARLRAEHLADLRRMHRDPRVMATLGGLRSDEETDWFLRDSLAHWERHGHGLWALRLAADGAFVGRGGLRRVNVEGCDEVELSYALMAEWWGQGLATELARALAARGFEHLGLTELVSYTLPTNRASQRVMEKVGLVYERDIVWAGLSHVMYRLSREQFRRCGAR